MVLTDYPVVIAFLEALRLKSHHLYDHSVHVGMLTGEMAESMELPNYQKDALHIAGLLHDIGKISLRSDILQKPGALNESEWEQMKMHPVIGAAALRPFPEMKWVASIIMCHHENNDGSGYPSHLKNEHIPFESKILRICDSFASMVSERSYKPAYPQEYAVEMSLGVILGDDSMGDTNIEIIKQKLLSIELQNWKVQHEFKFG